METRYREIRIAKYHGVIALSTINHAANTASVSSSYPDETTHRNDDQLVSPPPFLPRPRFTFFRGADVLPAQTKENSRGHNRDDGREQMANTREGGGWMDGEKRN